MKVKDIKPTQQNILIDITEISGKREEVLPSGIVIQKTMATLVHEESDGKTKFGTVVSCGPDCQYIEPGMKVMLPSVRGAIRGRIEEEGSVYIWVEEKFIPAILEE